MPLVHWKLWQRREKVHRLRAQRSSAHLQPKRLVIRNGCTIQQPARLYAAAFPRAQSGPKLSARGEKQWAGRTNRTATTCCVLPDSFVRSLCVAERPMQCNAMQRNGQDDRHWPVLSLASSGSKTKRSEARRRTTAARRAPICLQEKLYHFIHPTL